MLIYNTHLDTQFNCYGLIDWVRTKATVRITFPKVRHKIKIQNFFYTKINWEIFEIVETDC